MSKVLVTGGAGFIGSHVVERLLALGRSVICLDNFDPFYDPQIKRRNIDQARQHPAFTLVEGDIRDQSLVRNLFARYEFDRVFHAAAKAGVRPSLQDPFVYEEVNVRGTLNLLSCAVENRIKNFVFASSSSVYGANSKVPFLEEDPVDRPISPYAATKKACELLCYTYHHLYRLPITCLRFFTVYGPRQRPEMAIHKFTHLILEGQPIPLYGEGNSRRDYTYIDDAVDGVIMALDRDYPFEVINIGEARTVSLIELVALLEERLGRKAAVKHLELQPGDVLETWADLAKARRLLDYVPRTDIREGLQKFVEWYHKERTGRLCAS
ncbi:MAG TPA: GDP-mannose 4,6-dehydratase [Nitrospiria bacterium]|nr:GDP-mannose 4,6-dehydratase [Nitrospiria bacterium]